MLLINHQFALKAYQKLQIITCASLNRHYGNSPLPVEYFTKLQEVADRWPNDNCGRKMTLKDEIRRRATERSSEPIHETDIQFWENECQSLYRIANNHYRDIYQPPSCLRDGRNVLGTIAIAATGADLTECRRILCEREEKNVSLFRRFISKLFY
ncbi:unnamed protein product [Schistosoma turkestanicum]|nr:unnamed protein product [Schistosoma turkestanicum]